MYISKITKHIAKGSELNSKKHFRSLFSLFIKGKFSKSFMLQVIALKKTIKASQWFFISPISKIILFCKTVTLRAISVIF